MGIDVYIDKLSRSELISFIVRYTGLTREQVHTRIRPITFLYITNPETRKREYPLSVNIDKIDTLKRRLCLKSTPQCATALM